ncbi:hypothetical protein EV144_10853 [Flavobacterium sp. 270]|uniref:hypothetical protein n=1 Tax=Flavobacterium sp. 270 TaxID=2512114 RepID=UPI0010668A48|nr:hypothetical protein [Flavobacterium sp. 270]TDW44605.1 hypothetical protein EV144_10853 [Flavobacterium sp. 270]
MNTFIQLLVTTFFATSAMTFFSYVVSASFRKLYKEPLLLKYVLVRLSIPLPDKLREILAWFIHYVIGFIFVLFYHILWTREILPVSILSGILLGALSGIIGILSWIVMFKLAHFEGKASDGGYYIQLFIAHVIFGLMAMFTYTFFV